MISVLLPAWATATVSREGECLRPLRFCASTKRFIAALSGSALSRLHWPTTRKWARRVPRYAACLANAAADSPQYDPAALLPKTDATA